MAAIQRFDVNEAREFRRRAFRAWAEQMPDDTPEGWSVSPIDPAVVVAVFPTLRVRDGFVLRAYQYRSRRDGNGIVWAIPEPNHLSVPEALMEEGLDEPPRPLAALDEAMEAVEGDGTAWSHLCASLCARELAEIGAVGHGSSWSTHLLLDRDPWNEPPPAEEHLPPPNLGRPEEWTWQERTPDDWRPVVQTDDNSVTVEFCTLTALGRQELMLHRDTYRRGDYVPRFDPRLLASGPLGFVW